MAGLTAQLKQLLFLKTNYPKWKKLEKLAIQGPKNGLVVDMGFKR